ncbi:unnamed protein product [Macrosiphum euphorbiae]|uniref:Uncharacterized protein n=1 Tax=Macrosiphum euphorbiae TaxID=13131 RepID=A0AAV0WFY1_9HEMI|nr:unnamed protein product [Macrosiphum euphorbiae]
MASTIEPSRQLLHSSITLPATLKERSLLALDAGIASTCLASFDKYGNRNVCFDQKSNINWSSVISYVSSL